MCVDCILASSRIAQVDPGDEPLPEVVLSQLALEKIAYPEKDAAGNFSLSLLYLKKTMERNSVVQRSTLRTRATLVSGNPSPPTCVGSKNTFQNVHTNSFM
jgi:hypothetical protein